ncbi:MAG: glycosyltransferase family 39 protein [Acidobacteriota bacterium]
MTTKTRAFVCIALLLAALTFRLGLAVGFPNDEPDDARFYTLLARNVLLHGVYSGASAPPLTPTYVRVPGYPLLIATIYRVFGVNNNTAVRVAQALVDTACCWSIACLALALVPRAWPPSRRRRVQCAALGLAAVCPFAAVYVTTLLTEVLAIALGTTIAWCASRATTGEGNGAGGRGWRRDGAWWFATGLAGGALTIVRPEGGLLMAGAGAGLVLVCVRLWRTGSMGPSGALRHLIRCGGVLVVGFLVCDGPWMVRNARVFGTIQAAAPPLVAMPGDYVTTGYARWLRTWVNHPRFVGPFEFDQDRARFSVDQLPPWACDSPDERRRVAEMFAIYNDGVPGRQASGPRAPGEPVGVTPDLDAQFGALAAERIGRQRLRYYVWLPVERIFWMWAGPHSQYYPFDGDLLPLASLDRSTHQHIWLPLFALLTLVWTVVGLAGLLRLAREPASRMGLLVIALLVVPRLALLGSMENPEPRYLVELFPFLSALGGVAIGSLWSRWADRDAASVERTRTCTTG